MPISSRPVAVVVGASSGIGRQFAFRYAREGYDLVLVARSEKVLSDLAGELSGSYKIKASAHVADLSSATDVAELVTLVEKLPRLDHMVNSAGSAPEGDLSRSDADELRSMIDINISALTLLTRAAVIRMRADGCGTIINIASTASYGPNPYLAAYGASKSYVRMFTEAVHEENRAHGVRVYAVSPGATETPLNPGPDKSKRQPEQVVDTAWKALTSSTPSVVDGLSNSVVAALAPRLLPKRTGLRLMAKMLRHKA
ncbi:SDR family NAD(P)-dependent oxidoreductase [Streptomyces phaeoluteigriseus]|uniref:SDR family NAD(P)-dependent oxidoreductase n=1 Tax=Streptomyces phaeoluteigriseus TaxID=114686 RepID=UPI00369E1151